MSKGKRYLSFNITTRSEFVLALKYAEFHGFQPSGYFRPRLKSYNGGRIVLSVWLWTNRTTNEYCVGISKSGVVAHGREDELVVGNLTDFKYALDQFYHDGYLDEDNFKES